MIKWYVKLIVGVVVLLAICYGANQEIAKLYAWIKVVLVRALEAGKDEDIEEKEKDIVEKKTNKIMRKIKIYACLLVLVLIILIGGLISYFL